MLFVPAARRKLAQTGPMYVDAQTTFAGSASSVAVPLPAGKLSGDLLVIAVCTTTTATHTTPSGWTLGFTGAIGTIRLSVFYKTATGSEGSTQSVSFSAAGNNAGIGYLFRNVSTTPLFGTAVGSTSTSSPNPPSVSVGSTKKMIALAIAAYGLGGTSVVSTYPSGYTNTLDTASTNNANICSATLSKTDSSENPGTFGLPSNSQWVANTILVVEP